MNLQKPEMIDKKYCFRVFLAIVIVKYYMNFETIIKNAVKPQTLITTDEKLTVNFFFNSHHKVAVRTNEMTKQIIT